VVPIRDVADLPISARSMFADSLGTALYHIALIRNS
jgi:hypothetical protein